MCLLKGGRKLSKDGFLYIKNKTLTNGRTLDAAARFVAQVHQLIHVADLEGNDLLKARAGIKRSAKGTAEKTQNIITTNIAGLQENVLAQLPKQKLYEGMLEEIGSIIIQQYQILMIRNSTYHRITLWTF